MGLEIERKFLVLGQVWKDSGPGEFISQGYLNPDPARTVRVRIKGESAWLTIKGKTVGLSRAEFEYPVPLADAKQLLTLCEGPRVEKIRREIQHGGMLWEVDEFLGDNAGLVVAEIELSSAEQSFERPAWLGEEVSHDARYFNSQLASRPFTTW